MKEIRTDYFSLLLQCQARRKNTSRKDLIHLTAVDEEILCSSRDTFARKGILQTVYVCITHSGGDEKET